MESIFKINKFDSLDEVSQQEIQDFISGYTSEWQIEMFSHCDACGIKTELNRIETEGGIIRICDKCKAIRDKFIREKL